jgi:Anti-sigma factor NepR
MARELAQADQKAVRTGISAELRNLYPNVLHEEIPGKIAELIRQLDQLMGAIPHGQDADDP